MSGFYREEFSSVKQNVQIALIKDLLKAFCKKRKIHLAISVK